MYGVGNPKTVQACIHMHAVVFVGSLPTRAVKLLSLSVPCPLAATAAVAVGRTAMMEFKRVCFDFSF